MAEVPRQWHKRQQGSPPPSTPVPPKRGKSEENDQSMPKEELTFEDTDMQRTEEIKDVISTLRDLKDDARTHRNQIAYLLYTNVEKQRAESATKILVKNFWKYSETSDVLTQQHHREAIIQWIAKEAGVTEEQINKFTFDHKKGRQISPFTMIDTKDSTHRLAILEWQRKEIKEKNLHIEEWPTSDAVKALQNGQGNMPGLNGCLKLEPCISGFDKLQSEPLKACMTAISNLTQKQLNFRHSWKHLTIQLAEKDEYVLWIAMDYIYGDAKIYLNKALFNEKEFETAFKEAYQSILCRKSVGNKGKGKDSADNKLTPADLLKSVGLSGDGKGSYLKGGYLSIKATSPFLFTVRPIEAEQFYAKYQEHLSRLADHILHPTVML